MNKIRTIAGDCLAAMSQLPAPKAGNIADDPLAGESRFFLQVESE